MSTGFAFAFAALAASTPSAVAAAPGPATATAPTRGSLAEPGTNLTVSPAAPAVAWSPEWPRFRIWEYGATAVLGVSALYLYHYRPPPARAHWRGNNPFDDTLRDWLRARSPAGRARAGKVSDVLWLGGTAVPFVIDLPVVLLAHRQPGVAWQLLLMDAEANAVTGFINNALFTLAGRARPSTASCALDPGYDQLCGAASNNASFPSGHTVGIATAAGLTCVHHRYLPLYGSRGADLGACLTMSGLTVVTMVTRVMADRHYATDGLFGAALGFAGGYGLPWLLHYRAGGDAAGSSPARRAVAPLPWAAPGVWGMALTGVI